MRLWLVATLFGAMFVLLAGCGRNGAPDVSNLQPPVNGGVTILSTQSSQETAADALGRIGKPAVAALAGALKDADPMVRMQACRALAYMGLEAQAAVPDLVAALSDNEEAVQQSAANALGQIGAPAEPAVPALMEMLRNKTPQP